MARKSKKQLAGRRMKERALELQKLESFMLLESKKEKHGLLRGRLKGQTARSWERSKEEVQVKKQLKSMTRLEALGAKS